MNFFKKTIRKKQYNNLISLPNIHKLSLALQIFFEESEACSKYIRKKIKKKRYHYLDNRVLETTILDDLHLYKYLLLISASFYNINETFVFIKKNIEYKDTILEKMLTKYENNNSIKQLQTIRKVLEHYYTYDSKTFNNSFILKNNDIYFLMDSEEYSLTNLLHEASLSFFDLFLTILRGH